MGHSIQLLTYDLKLVREKSGRSQRAFSKQIGMPQSRLSKIENGTIDLRTSNLLELSRALGLEVMLVPRQLVPTVRSLINQAGKADEGYETQRPLYQLDDEDDDA